MAIHADDLDMRQAGGAPIGLLGIAHGNAEFIGFQPRGDIGVGFRVHIGVDAQGNGRGFAQPRGDVVEPFQLGQAFHVEAFDACAQRVFHFGNGFAYAGKNNFACVAACG